MIITLSSDNRLNSRSIMTSQTHGVLHSESKSRCIFDGNIVASKCSLGILGISVEEFNLTWKFKQI